MPESQIQITRPFGPSIAKVKMKFLADDEKSKKQDWGHKLAGHVKKFDPEFFS